MTIRNLIQKAARLITWKVDRFRMPSYSQEGEDRIIREFLPGGKGFYVDVGAHHPERLSNTAVFYESGWRGINIDPNFGCMKLFEKHRNGDINLEVGVSDVEGEASFFVYNEPALNGIENDRQEELRDSPYHLEKIVPIQVRTLNSILSEHINGVLASPNFLSIDVEGHEMAVLRSNDWDRFRFDLIAVEQWRVSLNEVAESQVGCFLSRLEYVPVASTGRTVIYRSLEH